jgi:glucose/arabinose dehydrogenase
MIPSLSLSPIGSKVGTQQRTRSRRAFRPGVDGLEPRRLLTTLPKGFTAAPITRGLIEPTSLAIAPDGRLFVAQETGQIRVIQDGHLLPTPAITISTDSVIERGVVGMAFDPQFGTDPYLYVYYTVAGTPSTPAHNRVSRFTLDGNTISPGSEVSLIDLPSLGGTLHNGGSLQFGADGKLYIAVGDNEDPSEAQSLESPLGKILRINPDGTIPADNPFVNQTTGINRAIWASGLRNPFSTSVQPGTGIYFINDVGEDAWEKVVHGVAGGNYGWPIKENARGDQRFQQPVVVYKHGPNDRNGCAITGGTFYNPAVANFPVSYSGSYFFTDFCGSWMHRLNPSTGRVTTFATTLPKRPVSLNVDASGNLYILSRGPAQNTGSVVMIHYRGRRR